MQSIGRTMSTHLSLPLAAMGAASVKAFSTFDSEMTKSTAIMNNVSKEMRGTMEQAAMSVSEDLNMASSKAAESFFFLASAGLDAEQSVAALPQVAEFAKAGMFDMATATDLATDAQSALGLTVDDAAQNMKNMRKVTDVLVNANKDANASVQQFATSLTNRGAASLRNYNKSLEEGVGVLAAFADQGIKGRKAGMFLSRMLRITSRAAGENTKQFKELGIVTPEGELASMANIVKGLTDALKGLTGPQQTAKLEAMGFTAEVQQAIMPLLGMSDALEEYTESAKNAGGATAEVANKQMKSFSEQLGVTWQMIRNAGIEIGEMLAPMLGKLNKILQAGVKAWRSLSSTTKGVTLAISGLAAAIGPITLAMGTMVSLLPTIMTGFAALTSPITGVIAAVGGLAAAFIYLSDNWEAVKERLSSVAWWKNTLITMSQYVIEFGMFPSMLIKSWNAVIDYLVNLKWFRNLLIEMTKLVISLNPFQALIKPYEILVEKLGMGLPNPFEEINKQVDKLKGEEVNIDVPDIPNPFEKTADGLEQLKSDTEDYKHQFGSFTDAVVNGINRITGLNLGGGIGKQMEIPQATLDTFQFATNLLNNNLFPAIRRSKQATKDWSSTFQFASQIINKTWAGAKKSAGKATQAARTAGQSLGRMFDQAILHGKNFMGVLKNIIKQLASKVFVQGITAIITGGSSLVAGSIGSAIFGGLFHGGGMVAGTGDRMIHAKGGEMVLTESQQRALGGMMGGGGTRINPKAISREIGKELDKRLQKLGPREVYAMGQQGRVM